MDIETIEELNNEFVSALNSADVSAVANMFTETAAILPPRRNTVNSADIQKYLLFFAQRVQNLKMIASNLDVLGPDLVREIGVISFRTRGENSARVMGRYFFMWQRVESVWKINTFFWSRNVESTPSPGLRGPSGV
jgi:ketosteroid isomerase-like protein